jgi:SAM-dependent methyltransferase
VSVPRRPATVDDFEQKYQANGDPWGVRHSWYERRKFAITMACLPRERYQLVWEPACSIGVLTGLIAGRADRVLSSDGSPTAIAAARQSPLPPDAGLVEWAVQELPSPPPAPAGSADLVMLSEILYYLAEPDRLAVLAAAHEVLAPGGDLVVVHWRPLPDDAYLSGDAANAWVRAQPGWSVLARHDDEEFVLDVLRRR